MVHEIPKRVTKLYSMDKKYCVNSDTQSVDRANFRSEAPQQYSDGTSNKVSNIIKRHVDNRELLFICILLLSHSLIFFRFIFYQYMVVFRFKIVIYVFLL